MKAWKGFEGYQWRDEINVRDFIQNNHTPYDGDYGFLENPTDRTVGIWEEVKELFKKEIENNGTLDIDPKIVSSIVSHDAGYINKDSEIIVGLQTDAPLRRAIVPNDGRCL